MNTPGQAELGRGTLESKDEGACLGQANFLVIQDENHDGSGFPAGPDSDLRLGGTAEAVLFPFSASLDGPDEAQWKWLVPCGA